ncbi:MAG: hypothetical protein KF746_11105 [Chitinophagaceae bacterium]|nr:hypothetical protein [Chitinophagaceae bacterium]
MVQNILEVYQSIASEIERVFKDQVKISFGKHIFKRDKFTVTCVLGIPNNISEDDYGIVFSTNAQLTSHYSGLINRNGNLFLISDISFGDGRIIATTEEFVYDNSIQEQAVTIVNLIRSFVENNKDKIFYELTTHYGLSVSRS